MQSFRRRKPVTQERVLTFLESYFSPRQVNINPILQNPSGVFVFDVESDGEKYLVGYSGITKFAYHADVVEDEQSLEILFSKWIALGYRFGFAFNLKYDLPALLMHARKFTYSHSVRNLGEFYYTRNYEIIRKKLFFELKKKTTHDETSSKLLFYDLLQYYQSSLDKAYFAFKDHILPQFKLTKEEEQTWMKDKKKRGTINDITSQEVIYYNSLDVKVTIGLVYLAGKNIEKLTKIIGKPITMGVTLPLTAEYAISHDLSLVDYSALDQRDRGDLYTALALSYRGGFFNSPKLGVFHGRLFKYDVNSMYPYMMTLIPSLKYDRRIDHPSEDQIDSPFDLVCGEFHGNIAVPIKVMKQSLVLDHTFGCFWAFEFQPIRFAEWVYEATDRQFVIPEPYESLKIKHLYSVFKYIPGNHCPLRDTISRLYKERLKLKKNGSPYEKVVKIIMNSSYGKYGELTFINPAKERLEYASLITAMGRVFINSLMPRDKIITYLTDSIITTEPLREDIIGDELGQLKEETPDVFDTLVNVNNGIYSFMRDGNILSEFTHTRGFAKRIENEHVAQKFFRKYLDIMDYVQSPYDVKIETKKSVMVRTNYMHDVLTKNGNYVEVSTEDLPTRGIKGRLVAIPTVVKGFNTKYIYTPFVNKVSEGKIIKDYFTSFLLHALFLLRDRGVPGTHVKIVPIVRERRNEIELECESINYYKHSLPDMWNVMTILCGGDHDVEKQISIDALKSFSTLNEKGEEVRALPLVHPPRRNFISNSAYMQYVRPPYKMHYVKNSDEGIDISDYLSDVTNQVNTETSTENSTGVPSDELIEDLIFAIDDTIEEEDLTVDY